MVKYCLHRYKTQEICDKAIDDFLPALKFVHDWFVTNKMLENYSNVVFSNDDIVLLIKILIFFTLFSDSMGLNTLNLDNANVEHDKFDEDDPETIVHVRITACRNRYKQRKAFKEDISKV